MEHSYMTDTAITYGGYASDIILNPADYDAMEINGVITETDRDGTTHCEAVFGETVPEFFSVYAHLVEGGVECIGDFATIENANIYAGEIAREYGYNVVDYTAGLSERLP
jgi:hypothetical protein